MHTLQHDVISNKTGSNKTRLLWIGSVQQPKLDFGRMNITNSNRPPLVKKKKKKDIKLLMPLYNLSFDLDSKKRNLKPVVEISTASTGIGLIMAQNKLHGAVCC